MEYWAIRTSRNDEGQRAFLLRELHEGRLRQGWGWRDDLNLNVIQRCWEDNVPLNEYQKEAAGHWRMGNGPATDGYMQVGDFIAVPNTPVDGLFTICQVKGDYYFEIAHEHQDFGHVRPVQVVGPDTGVANNHEMVHAALRRSFRCRSRMWNITPHQDCLKAIIRAASERQDFAHGLDTVARADAVIAEMITEPLNLMASRLRITLPHTIRAEEWEAVLKSALEPLFEVSVSQTAGPGEHGADIEIAIPNPFVEDRDWIVPVQVKDYEGEVGADVASQLEEAFVSRNRTNQVIAVVLLASNATASPALERRMEELSEKHHVPFFYCGGETFMRLLARGYLRRS